MTGPSADRIRILAVDDDPAILDSYRKILAPSERPQGSNTKLNELQAKVFGAAAQPDAATPSVDLTFARQGDEAVNAVRVALEHQRPFGVVFLDVRMPPGPDGVTTAEGIRALDPDIEIVIVTAYSDIDPAKICERVSPTDKLLYVQKPFHAHEVRQFALTLGAKWKAGRHLRRALGESYEQLDALGRANDHLMSEMAKRDEAERALAARTLELQAVVGTLERRANEAEALLAITRATESIVDEGKLFKIIAQRAGAACGTDRCTILLSIEEHGRLQPVASQFVDGRADGRMWETFRAQRNLTRDSLPPSLLEPLLRGEPVLIPDAATDPRLPAGWLEAFGSKSALVVPLMRGRTPQGVLILDDVRAAREFTPAEIHLAESLATHVAVAVGKAQLYSNLQRQLRQTETLLAVSQAVGRTPNSTEMIRQIARETVRGLAADCGGVWLTVPGRDGLFPAASYHVPPHGADTLARMALLPDDPLVQQLRSGPVSSDDCSADPRVQQHALVETLRARSLLIQPVSVDSELAGIIAIAWLRRPHECTSRDRQLVEAIASQIAVAVGLHRAQQHLVQQERLRALGQMASGIAHDLNNALVPIVGHADMLCHRLQTFAPEEVKRRLRLITTAASDAANIVSRLREFYRPQTSVETLACVDIRQLIEQVRSLTQPRWKDQVQASGHSVAFELDCPMPLRISGHEPELREALVNLVFNAVDAMPSGGTLRIRAMTDLAPGRQEPTSVSIVVSDTGIGMTDDVRRRCLEPFFSTKGEGGSGLGLAMVFGIVRRHGGTLDIRSEPGKGTSLTIRLPIRPAPDPDPSGSRPVLESQDLQILLIDDDPRTCEVLADYLTEDGHTVTVTTSGREGLTHFEAGAFDLVITDRAMPDMSGDQVARFVKARAPETPIIMLTGFGSLMNATAEKPAGIDVVVSKPPTLAKIREALASVTAPHARLPS